MARMLAFRGLQLVLVLFGISAMLFFLIRLSGDPAAIVAGSDADPAMVEEVRRQLGLDKPVLVQFGIFLIDLLRLDFGLSYQYRVPAMDVVFARLGVSIQLTVAAIAIVMAVSIPLGVAAAVRRGRPISHFAQVFSLFNQSVPSFVLGILLIMLFSVGLGVLPSFGYNSAVSIILPAITLASFSVARQLQLVRSYMIDELHKDYVQSAIANGIPVNRVRYRHALPNVLPPILSLAAIDMGAMIGGAIITETVFSWPGVGRLLVEAVLKRDYPVMQAAVFVIAVIVVVINMLVEVANQLVDPRLRTELK